jgi:hypothetical protein
MRLIHHGDTEARRRKREWRIEDRGSKSSFFAILDSPSSILVFFFSVPLFLLRVSVVKFFARSSSNSPYFTGSI